MSEAEAPKRGRGRPRLNPVDGVRRNVTLAVSAELYDLIKQRSDESGRSLSREIELSLDKLYSGAVDATTQQAVSEAVEAARLAEFEEIQEDFGGQLPFTFMRQLADAFNAELRKAANGEADYSALFLSDNRRGAFAAAVAEHIPGILKSFGGLAALLAMSNDIGKIIDALKTNKPEQYRLLEKEFSRVLGVPHPAKSDTAKSKKEN